jgi:hypothetical protein
MIGRPARVSVVHSDYNGTTYANIGLIRADKSGDPLKPSGKYVRQKDRQNNDEKFRPASNGAESGASDWRRVKVHVGKHKGVDLGDLDAEAVTALIEKWLPKCGAEGQPKPTADDKRLQKALLEVKALLEGGADGHCGALPGWQAMHCKPVSSRLSQAGEVGSRRKRMRCWAEQRPCPKG